LELNRDSEKFFGNIVVNRSKSNCKRLPKDEFFLSEISFESSAKKSHSKLRSPSDKEMSIRELQLQQKIRQIQRLDNLNDSLIEELSKKNKKSTFQEVLINPSKKIQKNLHNYSRHENKSVERLERTNSPFKNKNFSKPPLPTSSTKKFKPRPTFDLGPHCYYLTEKEENFRWNDISSQQLADKVRKSIQEVDQVLRLNEVNQVTRSVSTNNRQVKPLPQSSEKDDCLTPSPRASFKRFRELLKSNNLVIDSSTNTPEKQNIDRKHPLFGSKISWKTNCDTDTKDENLYKPITSISPNLRYRNSDLNTFGFSAENKIFNEDLKLSGLEQNTEDKRGFDKTNLENSSKSSGMFYELL
jgi:hypothetical protein